MTVCRDDIRSLQLVEQVPWHTIISLLGRAGVLIGILLKYGHDVKDLMTFITEVLKLRVAANSAKGLRGKPSVKERPGAQLFGEDQFVKAAVAYVEPDCQSADPNDAAPRDQRDLKRRPLFQEMERLLPNAGNKYVFLLADSGMGKTAFILNYYSRHLGGKHLEPEREQLPRRNAAPYERWCWTAHTNNPQAFPGVEEEAQNRLRLARQLPVC